VRHENRPQHLLTIEMGKWCTYGVLNAKKDTIRRNWIESLIYLICWYSPIIVITGYIGFPYEKTYLAESRRIPLRLTESEGLIAQNYQRLHTEKSVVTGIADCFNYLEHQYW